MGGCEGPVPEFCVRSAEGWVSGETGRNTTEAWGLCTTIEGLELPCIRWRHWRVRIRGGRLVGVWGTLRCLLDASK